MQSPPLLTPVQIAERLGVATRTAYDLLAKGGALHHLRIQISPKIVRVDAQAFDEYLQEKAAQNADR